MLNVFTSAAEALINDDPASFLDSFDRNMPGYAALQDNVKGLLAAYDVGATIEEITDEGDDRKRTVELDWLLILSKRRHQQPAADAAANREVHRRAARQTVEDHGSRAY